MKSQFKIEVIWHDVWLYWRGQFFAAGGVRVPNQTIFEFIIVCIKRDLDISVQLRWHEKKEPGWENVIDVIFENEDDRLLYQLKYG